MSFSISFENNNVSGKIGFDQSSLVGIFGSKPSVGTESRVREAKFTEQGLVAITGFFVTIVSGNQAYAICSTGFTKNIGSSEIKGDGLIEGPWNDTGKNLTKLFFKNHEEGSIIYINEEKRTLVRNNSEIEFIS